MSRAYYNEIDPFAAAWLRELIDADLVAPGDVDERPIQQLTPQDLHGYTQCHFFAGIGVWSYALRLAGWPDDQEVWTGSCPCQPFSVSGKHGGFDDERHLWPEWIPLIRVREPPVIFGEQVASKDGLAWLDTVQTDMEDEGYAFGVADLCAAGIGAPHIRQRLYFVAESDEQSRRQRRSHTSGRDHRSTAEQGTGSRSSRGAVGLAYSQDAIRRETQYRANDFDEVKAGTQGSSRIGERRTVGELGNNNKGPEGRHASSVSEHAHQLVARASGASRQLANPNGRESCNRGLQRSGRHGQREENPLTGFWSDAEWIPCVDGKVRPVEPGTFPLVAGTPARVGRLRGYGNALNAEVARTFIEAYLEA